jgi:hypothetical protein
MENSSKRLGAQPRHPGQSRRTILKLAAAAPLASLPIATATETVLPIASAPVPPAMAGYYAFLLLELAEIEDLYGLPEMDLATAQAGAERGAALQGDTTVDMRNKWLSIYADTRAAFARKEA